MNPTVLHQSNGSNRSLARLMSDIMSEIQCVFGPRDESFLFIGWEFTGDHPETRLSETGNKQVLIMLSMGASESWNAALHELAHECVHLLSPVGGGMACNLEEGVATWFADRYYRKELEFDPGDIYAPYLGAYEAVEDLFEHSEAGHEVIRDLRQKSSSFYGITASDILAAAPTLDPRTADFLVREWYPGSSRTPVP